MTIADEQLFTWRKHFEKVLNLDINGINVTVMRKFYHFLSKTTPPTKTEVINAINAKKTRKAAGVDNITAEVLKADVRLIVDELHPLLVQIWKGE